jgi:hypothetical protein
MAVTTATNGSFILKAYAGDNKTLLAFNFSDAARAKNLAGFTIECQPPGTASYYLFNELQFQDPSKHAQVASNPPNSTINAPIQKYRWTHVPGTNHQGTNPATGPYKYTVTPRYFNSNQSMQALDNSLSAAVTLPVGPFKKGNLTLGFTRGYMQSEAFAKHFGSGTRIVPQNRPLQFNTTGQAGTNPAGQSVSYAEIYTWMGSSARQQVFSILNNVLADATLQLDVFAYDLDEPDVIDAFIKLAQQGRIRIILDNAQLHVTHKDSKTGKTVVPLEDPFTTLFNQQKKSPAAICRGSFGRYSHDKIFIVSRNNSPIQVMTGSTNFSVTGLYVNANHVLVFDDPNVAAEYAKVFQQSWSILTAHPTTSKAGATAFAATALATQPFTYESASVPNMSITFSPHTPQDAGNILNGICSRILKEASAAKGNVLFAVMQLTGSQTPVYETLCKLHENESLFSYGISDAPQGVYLYQPKSRAGVLVTGKPGSITLPPPFDQVPTPPGHEIHDKFVVCGLNGNDPVVYCGSSNLASGGEAENGDNLLQIHDADVATAFAIEALLLVDHYNFLDRYATTKTAKTTRQAASASTRSVRKRPGKAVASKSAAKPAKRKRPASSSKRKKA